MYCTYEVKNLEKIDYVAKQKCVWNPYEMHDQICSEIKCKLHKGHAKLSLHMSYSKFWIKVIEMKKERWLNVLI